MQWSLLGDQGRIQCYDKLFIHTQLWLPPTYLATQSKNWRLCGSCYLPLCVPVGFIYIIKDGQSTLIDVSVKRSNFGTVLRGSGYIDAVEKTVYCLGHLNAMLNSWYVVVLFYGCFSVSCRVMQEMSTAAGSFPLGLWSCLLALTCRSRSGLQRLARRQPP